MTRRTTSTVPYTESDWARDRQARTQSATELRTWALDIAREMDLARKPRGG